MAWHGVEWTSVTHEDEVVQDEMEADVDRLLSPFSVPGKSNTAVNLKEHSLCHFMFAIHYFILIQLF